VACLSGLWATQTKAKAKAKAKATAGEESAGARGHPLLTT